MPIRASRLEEMPDSELLRMRFCDLPLHLKGSVIEERAKQVFDELTARGIRFRPTIWIAEEWYNPDGVVGFAKSEAGTCAAENMGAGVATGVGTFADGMGDDGQHVPRQRHGGVAERLVHISERVGEEIGGLHCPADRVSDASDRVTDRVATAFYPKHG